MAICLQYYVISVDATMLKIEGDSEIEVEQGQTFDVGVLCTNLYGERSHGKIHFFIYFAKRMVG